MRVRKAKTTDIPNLIVLYHNVKEIRDFAGQKKDKGYFLSFMKGKDKCILIAENHGEIVGALNAEFDDLAKFTFIVNAVVGRKHRGRGIGGVLMKSLERLSKKRKHNSILGLVYDWNKNMQEIMEHYQYKQSGKMILYAKKIGT